MMTALMVACDGGSKDVVQVLIAAGADVHMRDTEGETALMMASRRKTNAAPIVKMLVSANLSK